ncbi:MAG: nucleotidyltransferase domain-containing protein [Candidatus Nanohaloarchaea archaeon]
MKDKGLSRLVFQQGKLKILEELLDHPEKKYSISDLSEESGASYDLTHRFVKHLSELGIISRKKLGGSVIVQLNQESPYVEKLKELVKIDSQPLVEKAEQYAEELKREKEIESVILFGSVARGTPRTDSDIDVLILVGEKEEEIERYSNQLASKYEREEQITLAPVVQSRERFLEDLETESPFAEEVKKEGIVLTGRTPWQNGKTH